MYSPYKSVPKVPHLQQTLELYQQKNQHAQCELWTDQIRNEM